jgi:hypothetical protein
MAKDKTTVAWERVSESQRTVFEAAKKLEAFGALLSRQAENREGFTDLYGLGLCLQELSEALLDVWRNLDAANLRG